MKKVRDAVLSQFVSRGVLDQSTVDKLISTIRDGTKQKSLNLDALGLVFSDEQKKAADEIMNTVCETLEDTFLAHATDKQKRQMLALIE